MVAQLDWVARAVATPVWIPPGVVVVEVRGKATAVVAGGVGGDVVTVLVFGE